MKKRGETFFLSQFSLQLHDGVAGVLSDATLVVLVACHPDVALVSK